MKKIITTLIIGPIIAAIGLMGYRLHKNVANVVPYPYVFEKDSYAGISSDAPILIVGDRLGERLGTFSQIMAAKISENLSKPIKIESIAAKGEGLHRTLQKIKSLKRPPLILIYLGGSEESFEPKFRTRDLATIKSNIALYQDERVQTLLMIFPQLSRVLYHPVNYQLLGQKPLAAKAETDTVTTLKRNEISFKLYEQELNDFFSYAKERNTYVMAVSSPINLDVKPRSSCPGSFNDALKPKLEEVMLLIEKKDFKQAYNLSKELSLMANANARVLFIHGKIAKKLGKIHEAQKFLELAAAFDCENWRGSPVYNEILRKAADKHDVAFFDLQQMLKDHWTENVVFFDDIYPQNLYMEKMAQAIAARIKKLLKL